MPLNSRMTLAGNMYVRYVPAAGETPFWEMSWLGGDGSGQVSDYGIPISDQVTWRGYGAGRYIDNNLESANMELRTRVYEADVFDTHGTLEVDPFLDLGRVYHYASDNPVRISQVHPAGGVGFRIIPQGGNIRFLGTVELQFPVTTIGSFPLVGAVFVDAGSIFDSPSLFDFSRDVKFSAGLTILRVLTPVGPLSLEYAYPLTQTLAEEQWKKESWYLHWPGRIHFNWGIPILR